MLVQHPDGRRFRAREPDSGGHASLDAWTGMQPTPGAGWDVVEDDGPTLGAMLGAVRAVWGSTAHLVRLDTHESPPGGGDLVPACWWALAVGLASVPFRVWRDDGTSHFLAGKSEAEALAAARKVRA
jgi:hypothetical protein